MAKAKTFKVITVKAHSFADIVAEAQAKRVAYEAELKALPEAERAERIAADEKKLRDALEEYRKAGGADLFGFHV